MTFIAYEFGPLAPAVGLLFLVAILMMVVASRGLVLVRQSETMVIERLGRYHRTLAGGLNVIWPFFDTARDIHWRYTEVNTHLNSFVIVTRRTTRIDLRETVYDFPRQNVITRDNVGINISTIVYFQVTDAVKTVYEIANLPDAIEKLSQTTLRNIIGELDLDETLTSRDTINKRLGAILDEATHKWGVKVNRVELQDIKPPDDIQAAMEKQMRAERDRRAVILEAEGQKRSAILQAEGIKESEINRAEGEKQSAILRAEGQAQATIRIAEGEMQSLANVMQALGSGEAASAFLIGVRYLETMKYLAGSNAGDKMVFMPYEASGVLSALGGMKELRKNTPLPKPPPIPSA